jgi:hypothetical protein
MADYKYRAADDPPVKKPTPQELARNGLSPAAAAPPATVRDIRPPEPPKQIRGAVKVAGFPERSKYPFRQIADDGGVWQIDPAVFKVTPGAIIQAARKWAETRPLQVKATTDDGMVFVQFKAGV